MNIFNLRSTNDPLSVIDEIKSIKNKIKRAAEYVKDKQKIADDLNEELNKLNQKYYMHVANETYVKLSDLIKAYGEACIDTLRINLKHISKIKDDNKWMQSKISCWICEVGNHSNVCADCGVCDRGLEKCEGTKITLIQVKEEDQGTFL